MTIAIIGAGMAGLTSGTRLAAAGHDVTVFDKGRGPGGRMATRRVERDGATLHFDHGAQYFTARDQRFIRQVRDWEAAGIVAGWPVAGDDAYVGTPGMNAPIRALAQGLNVCFGMRIDAMGRSGEGWRLDGEGVPETVFDTVLVAIPAEQVAPLVTPHAPALVALAQATRSEPCWTLMAAFDGMVEHGDILRDAGAIGWAARNAAKPGRDPAHECWVIQGSPEWSRKHLEMDADDAAKALLAAFGAQGFTVPPATHMAAHRWRYARSGGTGENAWWDGGNRIGACGDWLIGPRVESAFLAGYELADAVISDG